MIYKWRNITPRSRRSDRTSYVYMFGKAIEKQMKIIEGQREKQLKEPEEHGKQLVKSITFAEKEEKSVPFD